MYHRTVYHVFQRYAYPEITTLTIKGDANKIEELQRRLRLLLNVDEQTAKRIHAIEQLQTIFLDPAYFGVSIVFIHPNI
jgi:hypothetical protein